MGAAAQEFADFLKGEWARSLLLETGFAVPPAGETIIDNSPEAFPEPEAE